VPCSPAENGDSLTISWQLVPPQALSDRRTAGGLIDNQYSCINSKQEFPPMLQLPAMVRVSHGTPHKTLGLVPCFHPGDPSFHVRKLLVMAQASAEQVLADFFRRRKAPVPTFSFSAGVDADQPVHRCDCTTSDVQFDEQLVLGSTYSASANKRKLARKAAAERALEEYKNHPAFGEHLSQQDDRLHESVLRTMATMLSDVVRPTRPPRLGSLDIRASGYLFSWPC